MSDALPPGPRNRVVVMGMMASGKSSTGRRLATRLGWAFWDNDDQLVAATGRDARSLNERDGPDRTHLLEAEVLSRGLHLEHRAVVCAPGSATLSEAGRRLLAPEWVVWLRARPETLAARAAADSKQRPFLGDDPLQAIRDLYARRRDGYAAVADLTVEVDDLDPDQAATRISEARDRAVSAPGG